jgi:sortase A
MRQGLERLFWVIGGLLILPFILQQGLVLSRSASPTADVPQLYSMPVARPATATAVSSTSVAQDSLSQNSVAQNSVAQKKAQPDVRSSASDINQRTAEFELQEPDSMLWSESRRAAWRDLVDMVARPEGSLLIPSLGVEVPVFQSANEVAFTLGAGIIEGTGDLESNGNIGMASHRDGHFRHLKDVSVGDLIMVKTAERLRQFQVVETRIVEPSETWVLDRGDTARITLVTCYPFHFVGNAPQRYIVSAQEVQSELTSVHPSHTVIGGYDETLRF